MQTQLQKSTTAIERAFDLQEISVNAYRLLSDDAPESLVRKMEARCRFSHASRLERTLRRKEAEVLPLYVAVIERSRHFGGHEEGGWYYDSVTVAEVRRTYCWQQAVRIARELKDDYPTCPYGRGSVLGGTDVEVRVVSDLSYLPAETTEKPTWC